MQKAARKIRAEKAVNIFLALRTENFAEISDHSAHVYGALTSNSLIGFSCNLNMPWGN
jgi:hypothetical protein